MCQTRTFILFSRASGTSIPGPTAREMPYRALSGRRNIDSLWSWMEQLCFGTRHHQGRTRWRHNIFEVVWREPFAEECVYSKFRNEMLCGRCTIVVKRMEGKMFRLWYGGELRRGCACPYLRRA